MKNSIANNLGILLLFINSLIAGRSLSGEIANYSSLANFSIRLGESPYNIKAYLNLSIINTLTNLIKIIFNQILYKNNSFQSDLFEFQIKKNIWKNFFYNTNTKIFLTWYNMSEIISIWHSALSEIDSILAIYQRSFIGNPTPPQNFVCDVFFGFGKLGYNQEILNGSCIDYYVITGYYTDYNFSISINKAKEVRRILNDQYGKPSIKLKGSTANFLKRKIKAKKYSIYLSLSDDAPWAQATVIISYN